MAPNRRRPTRHCRSFNCPHRLLLQLLRMPKKKAAKKSGKKNFPSPSLSRSAADIESESLSEVIPDTQAPPTGQMEAQPRRKKMPKRTHMTYEEEQMMVDFLLENPFLYDKKRKLYQDKALSDATWTQQATKMGTTKEHIKTWYDSMRTRYGKMMKEQKKSGTGRHYYSERDNWILAQFSFLAPFIADRRQQAPQPMVSIQEMTAVPLTLPPTSATVSVLPEEEETQDGKGSQSTTQRIPSQTSAGESMFKLTEANEHQLMSLTREFLQKATQPQGDPIRRAFTEYVGTVLNKLPQDLYRQVSRNINDILSNALDELDTRAEGYQRQEYQQHQVPSHPQPSQTFQPQPLPQFPPHYSQQQYQSSQFTSPANQFEPQPSQYPSQRLVENKSVLFGINLIKTE